MMVCSMFSTLLIPFIETAKGDDPPWYNSNWAYRKNVTINSSYIDADLVNFPILVRTTMNTTKVQADGDDILFVNATGDKLDHEIEVYNATTGFLTAWVRIPSLSSSVDTVIYLYYGNAGCASQQNATGVWDEYYMCVRHLNEGTPNGTSGEVKDSTINGLTGTATGSGGEFPTQITTNTGYGLNMSSKGVIATDVADARYYPQTQSWCLEAYLYPKDKNDWEFVASFQQAWNNNRISVGQHNTANKWVLVVFAGTSALWNHQTFTSTTFDEWQFFGFSFNNGGGNSYMYHGRAGGWTKTDCGSKSGNVNPNIAGGEFPGCWLGYYDEVRISKGIVRSEAWHKATFNTIHNYATFNTFGAEEENIGDILISGENPANESINVDDDITQLSVYVEHTLGASMDITIEMNGQAPGSWIGVGNGTRTLVLSSTPLAFSATYTWYVNVTDGIIWENKTFTFTTEANIPPEITNPNPANGSTGVSRSTSIFSVLINDTTGQWFDWSIEMSTGDSSNGNHQFNGTKSCGLTTPLPPSMNITAWANVTDEDGGINSTWFWFITTANAPPTQTNPNPMNTAFNKSITTASVSIALADPDGDYPLTYYITCVNTGDTTSGGGSAATRSLTLTIPLNYSTTYIWWVNVSDSLGTWTNTSYSFSTKIVVDDWIDLPQLNDVDIAQWGFYAWVYVLGSWFWGGFFGVLGAALFIKTENAAVTAAWFLAIGIITMAVWPMDMIYMIGILAGVILGFLFAALILER